MTVPTAKQKRLDRGLSAAQAAVNRLPGKRIAAAMARPVLAAIRMRFGMTSLDLVARGERWMVRGVVNPGDEEETEKETGTSTPPAEAGTAEAAAKGGEEVKVAEEVAKASVEATERRFVFRGDDFYLPGMDVGIPLDSEEAAAAKIQKPWEHVREKEGAVTSRYVSFSDIVGGPKGGAAKFAKKDAIYKAAWDALKELEKAGQIRILTPADVEKMMLEEKPKIKKLAGEVRRLMEKNHEVLIEGHIPGSYMLRTK